MKDMKQEEPEPGPLPRQISKIFSKSRSILRTDNSETIEIELNHKDLYRFV